MLRQTQQFNFHAINIYCVPYYISNMHCWSNFLSSLILYCLLQFALTEYKISTYAAKEHWISCWSPLFHLLVGANHNFAIRQISIFLHFPDLSIEHGKPHNATLKHGSNWTFDKPDSNLCLQVLTFHKKSDCCTKSRTDYINFSFSVRVAI